MTEYLELPVWLHHVAMLVMSVILIVYFLCRAISAIFNLDSFTEEETGEYVE